MILIRVAFGNNQAAKPAFGTNFGAQPTNNVFGQTSTFGASAAPTFGSSVATTQSAFGCKLNQAKFITSTSGINSFLFCFCFA